MESDACLSDNKMSPSPTTQRHARRRVNGGASQEGSNLTGGGCRARVRDCGTLMLSWPSNCVSGGGVVRNIRQKPIPFQKKLWPVQNIETRFCILYYLAFFRHLTAAKVLGSSNSRVAASPLRVQIPCHSG